MKLVNEILDEVTQSVASGSYEATLKKYAAHKGLQLVCQANFSQREYGLSEGYPASFKLDPAPEGLTYATVASDHTRISKILLKDLPSDKKESLFVEVLENLHEKEAEVLVFAKDKALKELYPILTEELCRKVGLL